MLAVAENLTSGDQTLESRVLAGRAARRAIERRLALDAGGKARTSLCPERRLTSDQSPVSSSSAIPAREKSG